MRADGEFHDAEEVAEELGAALKGNSDSKDNKLDIGFIIAEYKDILENADYDDLSVEKLIKEFVGILEQIKGGD